MIRKIRKYKNGLLRKLYRFLKLHPANSFYLSGDSFRTMAQHVHDMDSSVQPQTVRERDIVFVQSPSLHEFITDIHPHITAQYTLITHNGDENIDSTYVPFLEDTKIVHWFAQNCLISHPKITPLPIGLENKWFHLHGIPSYFNHLRKMQVQKLYQILYKFSVSTNPPERGAALVVLEKHPLAVTYTDWRESFAYLTTQQTYAFIASPPGNGEDCIRTWESMYLGTVPIVKRSALTQYFFDLGLPIVLVDTWDEIAKLSKTDLETIYTTLLPKFNNPALSVDFWKHKILTTSR